MTLCCSGKGCAHKLDKPDHRKGWLVIFCPKCERTTDHFPVPDFRPPAPKHGHMARILRSA